MRENMIKQNNKLLNFKITLKVNIQIINIKQIHVTIVIVAMVIEILRLASFTNRNRLYLIIQAAVKARFLM